MSWQMSTGGLVGEPGDKTGLVRHILLARLREGTPPERFLTVAAGFREMAGKIEGIVGFEYGTNNSAEDQNHGLTHVFTLTFANIEARDAYLPPQPIFNSPAGLSKWI